AQGIEVSCVFYKTRLTSGGLGSYETTSLVGTLARRGGCLVRTGGDDDAGSHPERLRAQDVDNHHRRLRRVRESGHGRPPSGAQADHRLFVHWEPHTPAV